MFMIMLCRREITQFKVGWRQEFLCLAPQRALKIARHAIHACQINQDFKTANLLSLCTTFGLLWTCDPHDN